MMVRVGQLASNPLPWRDLHCELRHRTREVRQLLHLSEGQELDKQCPLCGGGWGTFLLQLYGRWTVSYLHTKGCRRRDYYDPWKTVFLK